MLRRAGALGVSLNQYLLGLVEHDLKQANGSFAAYTQFLFDVAAVKEEHEVKSLWLRFWDENLDGWTLEQQNDALTRLLRKGKYLKSKGDGTA